MALEIWFEKNGYSKLDYFSDSRKMVDQKKGGFIQGVRGQSGFFNLALRERNIQVRLCLKVVLKS